MIVITLGVMITAVIGSIFISGNKNYNQDDRYARMQENGRFAMNLVAQDLSMAGLWGYLTENTSSVTGLGTDCGVVFDLASPVGLVNSPTATAANTAHSCISASTFVANTDVLTVKRVKGRSETSLTDGIAYLEVDGTAANLSFRSGGIPAYDNTKNYWRYLAHTYYIANKTGANGISVPTLYRKTLTGPTVSMTAEELIEGIENIQVQFGVDSDATADGVPNYFTSSPSSSDLAKAYVARISILARTLTPDPDTSYQNTSTYDLGEGTVGPFNDRYQRVVFTSMVALRNLNYTARR
ncbi:MAG: PilW family protein [Gammaproteobacteria bacterium]|nr:PilW family protein [Gammaproteobacteria bacterium]